MFTCCKTNCRVQSNSDIENLKNTNTLEVVKKESLTNNKIKQEYLSGTILINNKYPFWGEIKILKSFIETPSSINRELDECGYILEDSYEIWYYLNCEIEVSKTEYVFKKINFTSSNYALKYDKIVFSKEYSLSDFKNDFCFLHEK